MFAQVATPAALVDLDVFDANAHRGKVRAGRLGVALRPHAKTVKSPDLLAGILGPETRGFTVSTLGEIRALGVIVDDLLYAVPLAAGKASAVLAALGDADLRLTVVVDSVAGLAGVPQDSRIDVAIEIDCDGHRGGISPDDPVLSELAARVATGHRLAGVMTHGGGSYLGSKAHVVSVASQEREAVVGAALRLRDDGHDIAMVSVGSTPTFAAVDHLEGVTDARPGVYLFGDLSMEFLGACGPSDLALSVLATVIGSADGGRTSFIDAGWSALSQDRGVPAMAGSTGLGRVGKPGTTPSGADLIVSAANQEHGFVTAPDGGPTRFAIGERVQVWPNHACATAEMHRRLTLVRGGEVVGSAVRPRGW